MFCRKCKNEKSPNDFYVSWRSRCKDCIKTKQRMRAPEYVSWTGMRQRCTDKNCPSYKNYGGRGISFSPEWNDYEQFFRDMGPRPEKHYSLERINNDLGYSKENCCWARKEVQNRNKRDNVQIEFMGLSMPIRTWAIKVGINPKTLYSRITRYGWPIERALTQGVSNEWRNPL